MEFQFVNKSHYKDVAPLSYELAKFHSDKRPDVLPEIVMMTEKEFKKRIKIKGFTGLAVYEENRILGYCFCRIKTFKSRNDPQTKLLWIDEFYISEESRRKGVGTALFSEIKKAAKENGCKSLELEVWNMNESAKKFYDSVGFESQRIIKELVIS